MAGWASGSAVRPSTEQEPPAAIRRRTVVVHSAVAQPETPPIASTSRTLATKTNPSGLNGRGVQYSGTIRIATPIVNTPRAAHSPVAPYFSPPLSMARYWSVRSVMLSASKRVLSYSSSRSPTFGDLAGVLSVTVEGPSASISKRPRISNSVVSPVHSALG